MRLRHLRRGADRDRLRGRGRARLGPRRGARALLVAAGLGALAALELLAKLNAGITLLGLAAIAIACAPAARVQVGAALAGGFALAARPRLARDRPVAAARPTTTSSAGSGSCRATPTRWRSPTPSSGRSRASTRPPSASRCWAATRSGAPRRALPWRGRAGLALLWALLWFTAFKAAFVRPDALHVNIFFGSTLGGARRDRLVERAPPHAAPARLRAARRARQLAQPRRRRAARRLLLAVGAHRQPRLPDRDAGGRQPHRGRDQQGPPRPPARRPRERTRARRR